MSQGQSQDLMVSLRAVTEARSALERARTRGAPRDVTSAGQRRLLTALEDYAVALARHGHPMPYRMCSELAMYRAMYDPG
jgi:hypothetical protein